MEQLFAMAVIALLHLLVFLSCGTLVLWGINQWTGKRRTSAENDRKTEAFSASMVLIAGYFAYFCLFELAALPMVFLHQSLTHLSWLMLALLAIIVAAGCAKGWRQWVSWIKKIPTIGKEHSYMLAVLVLAVAFQCYAVAVYYDTSADAGYYVGIASTAVYTDTLCRYSPYTGKAVSTFTARYIFSCFPLHNAFVSAVTGIHPIIQAKTIMAVVNAGIANLIYYQIGLRLFAQKKSRKYADGFVVILAVIHLFCSTSYLPGMFLFTRLYEGKAILANLVFPMILYCSIRIWQKEEDLAAWIYLFLCNFAAVVFSGSALIVPFAASAVILPVIVQRKKYRLLISYAIVQLPVACWGTAYVLAKAGILSLSAK